MLEAVHNVLSIGDGRSTARRVKGAKTVEITLINCGITRCHWMGGSRRIGRRIVFTSGKNAGVMR